MHRLQVSLTQAQYDFLKSEAFVSGKSMAAILRDLLDGTIRERREEILNHDPIWQAIGVAQEVAGPTDVSANVDKYLYDDAAEPAASAEAERKVAEDRDGYDTD
jgi:hypothetical protein